jgi:hypothetical protein
MATNVQAAGVPMGRRMALWGEILEEGVVVVVMKRKMMNTGPCGPQHWTGLGTHLRVDQVNECSIYTPRE